MPIFNQSTIQWVSAVRRVADTVGASSDSEMLSRAHSSLRAAFQWLGGKGKWDFMRTEFTPQLVVAPFGLNVSATGASAAISAASGHGLQPDDILVGNGFMLGTRVSATGLTSITLTTAVTGATAAGEVLPVTAVRDMYSAPSDMRTGYSVRLLGGQKALRYVGQRFFGRVVGDEFASGTPSHYDFFPLGSRSKVRLLVPPGTSDVLFQRYYRRFTLASASGVTSNLDIPEDYEEFPIAWAKWHFLTDKGEGRKEQAGTWLSLAQDGLKTMLAEQNSPADEDLTILPGFTTGLVDTTRNTTHILWDYT